MAITTRDGLIAAMAASQRMRFYKGGVTTVAGAYASLWRAFGNPAAGAAGPANGSGVALTSASTGALPIPAPSNTSYLAAFDAGGNAPGTLMLCDRIAQWGVDAAVNTSQSMGAVTLPTRATSYTDMELWLEVETALGATQTGNITINYTDQGNAAGTTSVGQFPASAPAGRALPVSLASGDYGVRSVTSVQLTTATTGKLNAVLRRVICPINILAVGASANLGYPETDLEVVGNDSCLELMWLPQGTTAPNVLGGYSIAQG
jgi:hypothetical protein